ncbi:protein of unknown function, might belong to Cation efflux protein [Shewanella benthica]|uniref:Cation efflux protein cytoplasmic domain-containing protein n=1 Tax=Shewanella benthica TaxID=43661 RepID=A0A330M0X4_9GAMM|nr:hypothetical protein [Shewanella benthica]SQH76216.1 protein of unknown function, might belong to Cation efflux protein [Shewanella benthica]
MITLEVDVNEHADIGQIKMAVKKILQQRFAIAHSTVEINQYCQQQESDLKD